jgi:hypothetical protein
MRGRSVGRFLPHAQCFARHAGCPVEKPSLAAGGFCMSGPINGMALGGGRNRSNSNMRTK